MSYQLQPFQEPLGIFDSFVARQTETLVLREKVLSLSGDSFSIKLANGTPLLQVRGSVMSLSGRKSLHDMAGGHLFDIQKELLHFIHATFACVTPQGQKILEVKNKFSFLSSKAEVTFTTNRGKNVTLKMKGDWMDASSDIVEEATGQVVAHISRKLGSLKDFGKELMFGQQSYQVTVAPGVDMALVAAMCICFDEKNNEGGGSILG